jgi:large subunit ribosomal protein L21
MFAVIKTGGKQYKVSKGTQIWVEKLDKEINDEVVFDDVLMVAGDGSVNSKPAGATVVGKVVHQGRRKKVIVFRQIRRKRYRRTKGHRQYFTSIEITDIKA